MLTPGERRLGKLVVFLVVCAIGLRTRPNRVNEDRARSSRGLHIGSRKIVNFIAKNSHVILMYYFNSDNRYTSNTSSYAYIENYLRTVNTWRLSPKNNPSRAPDADRRFCKRFTNENTSIGKVPD